MTIDPRPGATCTDTQLVDLYHLPNVAALYDGIAGKRGMLFFDVEGGQWSKYENGRTWLFHADDGDDEPPDNG